MKRLAIAIALAFVTVPTVSGVPLGIDPEPEATRYAVGFHGLPRDMRVGDEYNGGRVVLVDSVLHFAAVVTDAPALFEARTTLDENVRYVEFDPEMQLTQFTPNDPRWSSQYGPQHVRAPEAWDTTLGDMDAKVCVVDTGVRYTHEDLTGSRWLGGHDFYNGDSDPNDDNGHGTHVAGTAAASINNGKGIAGIGNVGLYGVKVLSSLGSGSLTTVASGIRWCADNGGARTVISLSLGGSSGSTSLADAVQYAWSKGALVVAAAGNSGPCSNCVSYPAKYAEAIAVTCTNQNKAQCSFSSDGPESELAAPGQDIISTWHTSNTAYNTISGTSMSTPHVSGVAALVWSHATGLTNQQLRDLLRENAQDLGSAGWDEQFGYGLVDAKATLDAAGGGSPPPPPPDPQCSDGVDNDGDGKIDYPNDPGCDSAEDDDETDPAPPPGETLVYSMNFDDGASGWTKSSFYDLWHLGGGCLGYASPTRSLQFNYGDSDCTYASGFREVGWASSPSVNLAGKTQATLKFRHAWETESYSGGAYDVMRVQLSADGGSSWTTVRQWDSRDANQLSFQQVSFDASSYATSGFRVRFHFDSVDGLANSYDGWHVDDVEVWAS